MEHRQGIFQKSTQKWRTRFSKRAFTRVKWQCLQDFSGMFHKKSKFFGQMSTEHFWKTNAIRGMPCPKSSFFLSVFLEFLFFFGLILLFCQWGQKRGFFREVRSRCHATRQIGFNDQNRWKYCFNHKSPVWMSLLQLVEIHTLSHMFMWSDTLDGLLVWGNQLLVPSGWGIG